MHRRLVGIFLALCALLAIAGCGGKSSGALVVNKRPTIDVSNGPINGTDNFYDVRIDWFASDADGQVTKYIYAKDPPVAGDTVWTETKASEVDLFFSSNAPPNPLPELGSLITERGYHTFVVKAIDNEGLASAPAFRSFNSHTTAPSTLIQVPSPTRELAVSTVPSVTITWIGSDPDGVLSQKPLKYKFKLVKATDINPTNPNGVTQQAVQLFFGVDADNFFAAWDSVGGDTTEKFYQGLTPNTTYYFAIVAFDEAGAFEPRFNGDTNVLAFRPTLNRLGPIITVFNQYFARTQTTGGVSTDLSRIYPLEFPSDNPISFNWFAVPASQGAQITGYRWALDMANGYIFDETSRTDDTDLKHWSAWSLSEVAATVPSFTGVVDTTSHFFYLEARDNLGFVSLFIIQLIIVHPQFERNLLMVDDMYGTFTNRSRTPPGTVSILNPYPMEAEQDSFYYARGGFPDSLRILSGHPGAVSIPGTFSHFAYDTLDYRAWPFEGVSLEQLGKYKVVCWYTDQGSTAGKDQKFGGSRPMTAIRFLNSVNHLNTLAVYLAQGGKAWIFGDGMPTAIANGFYSRFSQSAIPTLPYASGDDPKVVLQPGCFLWDFLHLHSEMDLADHTGSSGLTANAKLIACLPYLPQYRLPAGQPVPSDRSLDPHVGASAQKTLDNGWGNLPRLTVFPYHGISTDPVTGYGEVAKTAVISKPNFITEGTGASFQSVVDTLYLCQTLKYDPNNTDIPTSDGFPNAISYRGFLHGKKDGSVALVWFGFPLYYFTPDQARQTADVVLGQLGLPQAPPQIAGAHPALAIQPGAPIMSMTGGSGETPWAIRRATR